MSGFQILTFATQQALDTSANVLSGATMQFSLTGTGTPTNAYADKDLTIPLSNPLSADAAGNFVSVFLDPAIVYRVVLKTQAGAVLKTWDPANENVLASIDSEFIGLTLDSLKRTPAELAAGVTPVNYAYEPGNVLRYGADPTGLASSQTAVNAAIAACKRVRFPEVAAGNTIYKCNILLSDTDDRHIFGDCLGVHLIPADNTKPVIDVDGSTGDCTGICIERLLLDSQATGSPTGIGIGLRVKATGAGIVIQSTFQQITIRGFNDGLVIDCDVNIGQVFNNDFDQIYCDQCTDRSFDIKGLYNRWGKIFGLHTGNYFIVDQSTRCTYTLVVGDGPCLFQGLGVRCKLLTIEAISGTGAVCALQIVNPEHQFDGIVISEVENAKCPVGVLIDATAVDIIVPSITITGTDRPLEPIRLVAGSSGIMGRASGGGSTLISTSTGVIATWRFLGDVSGVFAGDRYIDPNFLIENTGRIRQLAGGRTKKRAGLTYSATIATNSALGEHFTITVTNGTAFTISNPTNPEDGSCITYTIYNSSGGAMGVISWGGLFKMSAWTNPANGFSRSITFEYEGSVWKQTSQTGVDVPN